MITAYMACPSHIELILSSKNEEVKRADDVPDAKPKRKTERIANGARAGDV